MNKEAREQTEIWENQDTVDKTYRMILAIPKCDPNTPVILDAPDEIIKIFDGSFCEDNSFNEWHKGKTHGIYICEVDFHFSQGYFEGYRADGESDWSFTVKSASKIDAGYRLPEQTDGKRKVVVICGSTRFTPEMMMFTWEYARQGIAAIGWVVRPTRRGEPEHHLAEEEGLADLFDEVHMRKIDLADEVFVLNIGGYIGESTSKEIAYAESIGKPVKYLEPLFPKKLTLKEEDDDTFRTQEG